MRGRGGAMKFDWVICLHFNKQHIENIGTSGTIQVREAVEALAAGERTLTYFACVIDVKYPCLLSCTHAKELLLH